VSALLSFHTDEMKSIHQGRVVAQAISRWLHSAAAWVRVRAAFGVSGEQSGTGVGFLRVLPFPLPIISPISPPGAGTIDVLVGAAPSAPIELYPHYKKKSFIAWSVEPRSHVRIRRISTKQLRIYDIIWSLMSTHKNLCIS
jgi:hypothetical protein